LNVVAAPLKLLAATCQAWLLIGREVLMPVITLEEAMYAPPLSTTVPFGHLATPYSCALFGRLMPDVLTVM
jgi:hypothetical protein